MPLFYLQRADGTYSDLAEYDTAPTPRPEGTWVQGQPTEAMAGYTPLPPGQAIEQLIGTLDDARVLALSDVIAKGKPLMDAGRWGALALLVGQVQTDDPQVLAVLEQIEAQIASQLS